MNTLTSTPPHPHPSARENALDPTALVPASVPVKPTWMDWFCETDDLYWDGESNECWFCGATGRGASRPRLTSQHGFGPELVA